MATSQKCFYENGLNEFMGFMERLINESLNPYRTQIKGEWKSSTIGNVIRNSFNSVYEKTIEENHRDALVKSVQNKTQEKIKNEGKEICQKISESILDYFKSNGIGCVFVIDFCVYSQDVQNELFHILLN
jgi:hypothetical protein